MRVAVTGAGGFVGQRLIPRLEAEGHNVSASDREVDVVSVDSVSEFLIRARPHAVIHLAALSSVAASFQEPAACFRVNFLGARSVLEAVGRHCPEARVLLVGSGDQYEAGPPGAAPLRETDPLRPRSPYARTKAAAELLGALATRRGLDVVRVRAFNHTGAGQTDAFVASSFARQVVEIGAEMRPPLMRVGNLESVRDFLDVDDVVEAYLRLLAPSVEAGVYNVASGRGVSIRSLLDELLELGGIGPTIQVDPQRMRPTDQLVGDASCLRAATGWEPRVPLRDTLAGLLAHWRKHLGV